MSDDTLSKRRKGGSLELSQSRSRLLKKKWQSITTLTKYILYTNHPTISKVHAEFCVLFFVF